LRPPYGLEIAEHPVGEPWKCAPFGPRASYGSIELLDGLFLIRHDCNGVHLKQEIGVC
jgi:hypothetical protein